MNASLEYDSRIPVELTRNKRDAVSLLVIDRKHRSTAVTDFTSIAQFLRQGDVLVFNNSAIIPASISVYFPSLRKFGRVNIGTSGSNGLTLMEIRPRELNKLVQPGETAEVIGSYESVQFAERDQEFPRYIYGRLESGENMLMLASYIGKIIRYEHIPFDLPSQYYRTNFSRFPGSVEFPSASRPFTEHVLNEISRRGVEIVELTLHCNLASLEQSELTGKTKLLPESFTIPESTADAVNRAMDQGNRIFAVGTSVVRTLESAYGNAKLLPGNGITELFIRDGYRLKIVDGLITGMHEYSASHIDMVHSFADRELIRDAYELAKKNRFSWHEFGDLSIII